MFADRLSEMLPFLAPVLLASPTSPRRGRTVHAGLKGKERAASSCCARSTLAHYTTDSIE